MNKMIQEEPIEVIVFEGKLAGCNNVSQALEDKLTKLAVSLSSSTNTALIGKTVFDRISQVKCALVWDNIKTIFEPEVTRFQKSSDISTKLREKGNALYKQKNAEAALRAYSLAIAFAPMSSEQLCAAYANRSAVLLQMSKVADALDDIQRALCDEENCKNGLRRTLEDRKQKCKDILETRKAKDLINDREREQINDKELNEITKRLFEIENPNPNAPNAETFVQINYSPEKGRYLKVTKNVSPGTVLIVDKPFVSVLTNLLNWEVNHCHNCSVMMFAGVPCSMCTFAMFCSEECRKSACDSENGVHRFEHKFLSILRALNSSHVDIQALRILALLGPKRLRELYQSPQILQAEQKKYILGSNQQGIYDTKSYLPIFHLISHEQRPNKSEDSNIVGIKVVLKAFVLKEMLKQYSNFFAENSNGSESIDFENFIAALLLKHLESIKYNAISLSKMKQGNALSYSTALFPLISLCNHSCDPNCAPIKKCKFLKSALIALKPLSEGDELTITYKPLYNFMKTTERQDFLGKNYIFVCNCEPCQGNWGPGHCQLNGNRATLILEPTACDLCSSPENSKKKQCNQCVLKDVNRAKEIQDMNEILFDCHDFMEQGQWKECLTRLPNVIEYFGRQGFKSYFPLYHVALDLYKRSLVHGVAAEN